MSVNVLSKFQILLFEAEGVPLFLIGAQAAKISLTV
jgi:hypothetical protein